MNAMQRRWASGAALAAVMVAAVLVSCGPKPTDKQESGAADADIKAMKAQTRDLWSPTSGAYIRDWLVVGPMPNPVVQDGNIVGRLTKHVVGQGYDRDFLVGMGGESGVEPMPGDVIHFGSERRTWRAVTAKTDVLDFKEVFAGLEGDFVVAYAYATVMREQAGKAFLSLGSDDSVKAWVNGKLVHDHRVGRGVEKDEDVIPVQMKAGPNRLLFKVENARGGWALVARVLSEGQMLAMDAGDIQPRFEDSPPGKPHILVLNTDAGLGRMMGGDAKLRVEVVAAGGRVVTKLDPARGDVVELDSSGWPNGAYEVRLMQPRPDGSSFYVHLPHYKGDWRVQLGRILEARDTATPGSIEAARLAFFVDYISDRLGAEVKADAIDSLPLVGWQRVHAILMEHAEWENSSAMRPHGFVRMGWIDRVDGSPQFCRVYMPPDYDPEAKDRTWPLLVMLHGYHPRNPEYINWWGIDGRHQAMPERHGVIQIDPHGRGNTGYAGIGEQDVLRCVAKAKEMFQVDDARVYLTGYSMGGGGTWHLGTRHPHVFAAIAPIYGGWDYRVWMEEQKLAKMSPLRHFLAEVDGTYEQAESLLSTPVFVNHGDADELVDVKNSRRGVKLLQRWGYNVRYWEHPGLGHGRLGCEDEMLRWLLSHELQGSPREVRLRAGALNGARTHWVRVLQREDQFGFMQVRARVIDRTTIAADSENVLRLALTPGAELVDVDQPIRVMWNGRAMEPRKMVEGILTLSAPGDVVADLEKTPWREGPMRDVGTRPFAVVLGTRSSDARMRAFCKLRAEKTVDDWESWQHWRPRYFLDTDMTDEQVEQYSLILIGGPRENVVTRRLADQLPLTIDGGGVVIGDERFPAKDAAVAMIYPHPLNREAYVQVIAATSADGMYFTSDMDESMDYVVSDARVAPWGMDVPGEKASVVMGRFGRNWNLDDRFMYRGDAKVRATLPMRKAPAYLSADRKGKSLLLSQVLEGKTSGSFGYMMRDSTTQGRPLQIGKRTYRNGIAVGVWHEPNWADFDIEGCGWTRLRATVGIDLWDDPAELEDKQKAGTRTYVEVWGDGDLLHRCEVMTWADRGPREIDVDVRGVKKLRLGVASESTWHNATSSVNWGDVRLER